MEYLNYLADHNYDELPERVKQSISREAYTERRKMVQAVREPEEAALPPVLAAAFAARTQDAGKVEKSKVRWLPWLAAAGWLLFLAVSGVLLLREPETLLVEKTILAPAAPPQIIYTTDTLYQTVTQYRDRIQTVHDTIYEPVPYEQIVYVQDTIYLPETPRPIMVQGSRSISGKKKVLNFLFATE